MTTDEVLSKCLAKAFQPKEDVNVWQWAEKNIVLSQRVTPRAGPYNTEWCPYVREPQEVFTDHNVHTIVLCWSSRSSKTESMMNCIRYSIAQDPQSMLIVMPSEKLGRSFTETRFHPSINDCPALEAEKPDNPDQFKLTEMHFKRCTLWVTGANSPANLKGRGVTVLLCDEIDTWPTATEKETGALQQVMERTKDRWNRKHLLTSTPTIEKGQIWKEFKSGDQRYYYVPCPHCGEYQTLKLKQLDFEEEKTKTSGEWNMVQVKKLTWYRCEKCEGKIEDRHKLDMLQAGEWRGTVESSEPGRVSYHLNCFYPPWITFGEIAVQFLNAKKNEEDLQRFVNSWLAEPYFAYGDTSEQEAELMKMRDKEAPEGIQEGFKAIMTIDVQLDRVYFVIRAWNKDRESILVEYGCVPGFEECQVIAQKFNCMCVFVDMRYRPKVVLEWCRDHQGWIPCMGAANLYQQMRWVMLSPSGGLMRGDDIRTIRWRPHDYKEVLSKRMKSQSPTWKLHKNVGEDYKKQMVGEVRVERQASRGKFIVEWIKRGANHYWDCEVMSVMAFESIRIFAFDVAKEEQHVAPPSMTPAQIELKQMRETEAQEQVWNGEQLNWS